MLSSVRSVPASLPVPLTALLALALAGSSGCLADPSASDGPTSGADAAPGTPDAAPAPPDTDAAPGAPDALPPGEIPVTDGPAATLLIDGSVHTGTAWDGTTYQGVWGEPFGFAMADYPVTWAIAAVHASLLHRQRGIDYSPNAVLAIAIKESRLGCADPGFPNGDGCFQIESTTAYAELGKIYPGRFVAPHDQAVGGDRFEGAAIASAYYALFSMAMFRLYSPDPARFFADHPDPRARQKVLCAAYNRGLWWNGLPDIFANCADRDVTECFQDNAIAIDHADAIADYTAGLDAASPFDVALTLDDLLGYWQRIAPLYPDADPDQIVALITARFDALRGERATISFHTQLRGVLDPLIATLAPIAGVDDAVAAACGLGYLYGDACP